MAGWRSGASLICSSARSCPWSLATTVAVYLCLSCEGDFDALGVGDDVVVGEDVALLVEDEAGALALLRDGAVEEVEGDGGGGDVDDGGQAFFVDGDVLLLFVVVGGGGFGFFFGEGEVREGDVSGGAMGIGEHAAEVVGGWGPDGAAGEGVEADDEEQGDEDGTEGAHGYFS